MPRGGSAAKKQPNNFIAEWFGHRVYPVVAETALSLADQEAERCPFLTDVTGKKSLCIKKPNSKGVCTISSTSNGTRQDWLACPPYRALDLSMLDDAARRLFRHAPPGDDVQMVAVPVLEVKKTADDVRKRVAAGKPTIVYFQNKLGGEISISPTDRSPEFSFDSTMIELLPDPNGGDHGRTIRRLRNPNHGFSWNLL